VPPSGEGTAQLFLRPAALAIGVGGVEKGDAEIESLVHDGARRRIIDAPAEIVAAEPNRRDDPPGTTEIALLHRGCLIRSRPSGTIGRRKDRACNRSPPQRRSREPRRCGWRRYCSCSPISSSSPTVSTAPSSRCLERARWSSRVC